MFSCFILEEVADDVGWVLGTLRSSLRLIISRGRCIRCISLLLRGRLGVKGNADLAMGVNGNTGILYNGFRAFLRVGQLL